MNNQIRSKIKKIKIHTKRMMHTTLTGDYLSSFRGTGLEFHQIRGYQQGDDIRTIDWKSSAKLNTIMVKEFIEQRERTILVALDTSLSQNYGSGSQLKYQLAKDIAAALVCIGEENKDNVGLVLFNDVVHQRHPARKGSTHSSSLLGSIYNTPSTGKTNMHALCDELLKKPVKNTILFIVSDWINQSPEALKRFNVLTRLYDVIAMHITDPCEIALPSIGLITMQDPETGNLVTINTKSANAFLKQQQLELKNFFSRNRLRNMQIQTDTPWIIRLTRFLQTRTSY